MAVRPRSVAREGCAGSASAALTGCGSWRSQRLSNAVKIGEIRVDYGRDVALRARTRVRFP